MGNKKKSRSERYNLHLALIGVVILLISAIGGVAFYKSLIPANQMDQDDLYSNKISSKKFIGTIESFHEGYITVDSQRIFLNPSNYWIEKNSLSVGSLVVIEYPVFDLGLDANTFIVVPYWYLMLPYIVGALIGIIITFVGIGLRIRVYQKKKKESMPKVHPTLVQTPLNVEPPQAQAMLIPSQHPSRVVNLPSQSQPVPVQYPTQTGPSQFQSQATHPQYPAQAGAQYYQIQPAAQQHPSQLSPQQYPSQTASPQYSYPARAQQYPYQTTSSQYPYPASTQQYTARSPPQQYPSQPIPQQYSTQSYPQQYGQSYNKSSIIESEQKTNETEIQKAGSQKTALDNNDKKDVPVELKSDYDHRAGYVVIKIAIINHSLTALNRCELDFKYNRKIMRLERVQPDSYEKDRSGDKVIIGEILPSDVKTTVEFILDPLVCIGGEISAVFSCCDYNGTYYDIRMKSRRIYVVCPVLSTANIDTSKLNTATMKELFERVYHKNVREITLPKGLHQENAFDLACEVAERWDVKRIRKGSSPEGLVAWYYGRTTISENFPQEWDFLINVLCRPGKGTVELLVATDSQQALTGCLSKMGDEFNKAIEDKGFSKPEQKIINISDSVVYKSSLEM